ncbi:hypothetical protein M23134_05192 [Microscilla marina ATCC 23134]|uniref:Uncharacterized protein n=2 Tax=Microscilla marina TaxID=1027 RepID=A1ZDE7_MICM2|nr:hypothetical protein M23134_05192 [Microscilla marina ATCC 23134]
MRQSSFLYLFSAAFFTIFMGFFSHQVKAQEFSNAGEYWDAIMSAQSKVMSKSVGYVSKSVHSDNDRIIERKRRAVVSQIDESLARLKELKAFNGNDRFRKEALAVLQQMKNIYTIEFKEASSLQKNSQSSYLAMERYYKAQDHAEAKLDRADKRFKAASKYFAKQNNIKIVNEGRKDDAIEKMGQVNRYTRSIYLIDFKLSKANAGFMDAFEAKKAGVMERHRKKTLAAAREALNKLKAVKDFYGNSDYKKAAEKIARYRKKFASKEYTELVTFTKNSKKLTRKDVKRANQIIQELNQKNNQYVQTFNMAGRALRQQYTPKQ